MTSAQNREKLTPPPCRKRAYWLNPLPSCPCELTINFEKSQVFCTKKCGRPHLQKTLPLIQKMSTLDNPLTADVFMDSPISNV